jgi:hypothetical protein
MPHSWLSKLVCPGLQFLSILINAFSGFTFESSESEGAILTMPDGAYSENLSNVSKFRHYITTHAEDWYRFVNGPRGREAQNGDLHVVVGSDKTTSWGMATFSNCTLSQDTKFWLKFSAEQPSHQNGGNNYAWEHSGVAEVKVGPGRGENQELGETDSNRLRNQSLFLRTLNDTLKKCLGGEFPSNSRCYRSEWCPSRNTGSISTFCSWKRDRICAWAAIAITFTSKPTVPKPKLCGKYDLLWLHVPSDSRTLTPQRSHDLVSSNLMVSNVKRVLHFHYYSSVGERCNLLSGHSW